MNLIKVVGCFKDKIIRQTNSTCEKKVKAK